MTWSQVEQLGGKVVSYGSYKLSVVDKESDLDLLVVVPKQVSREDFFRSLFDQLAKKVTIVCISRSCIDYLLSKKFLIKLSILEERGV